MKYLIHACPNRKQYLENHLLPSLYTQGISVKDIDIYLDINNNGCLQSFLDSIDKYLADEGDTWHLQDDILICSDFKFRTEYNYETSLVCGFSSRFDKNQKEGKFSGIDNIWYSFPCIRIPNSILKHFRIWFESYLLKDTRFKMWLRSKKNDDLLFRYFIDTYYKDITATNLVPNLVEHVDWLIGGSLVNKSREGIVRSTHWKEESLVEQLKQNLKNY